MRELSERSTESETSPILDVREVRKAYRMGDSRVSVLTGVTLSVAPGEMVSIMGPSGTGKTTLLNCLSGIDTPDSGEVRIGEERVDYSSERVRTLLRRNQIGIVFQFFNLIPTLDVAENIGLPFAIARCAPSTYAERVSQIIEEVGLSARANHFPHQLSGGEMQLVSIARALVHEPSLLLADEPTGNVNPSVSRAIMDLLVRTAKARNAGVLLVTHSPEHAAWANRICFLKDGEIARELQHDGRKDDVGPIHQHLVELEI